MDSFEPDMGATNTKQMKFATSYPEGEGPNMNSKSQHQGLQQGHKSWDIGQSQNLRCHEKHNEQTPAATDSRENLWRKSKEERQSDEEEEQQSFETGYQTDIKGGVWVDCGLQDFGWSREEHHYTTSDAGEEEEEEKLPFQVRRILPVQVDHELPMQVSRKLPMQVDQDLPIQVRKILPMQVGRRGTIQ